MFWFWFGRSIIAQHFAHLATNVYLQKCRDRACFKCNLDVSKMIMRTLHRIPCERIRTLFGLYKMVKIQPRIAGIDVSKHMCPAYLGEKKGTENLFRRPESL